MSRDLDGIDWSQLRDDPDSGAVFLTEKILDAVEICVSRVSVPVRSSHPWLTEECYRAVVRKAESADFSAFPVAACTCSQIFLNPFNSHCSRIRSKLRILPRGLSLVEFFK